LVEEKLREKLDPAYKLRDIHEIEILETISMSETERRERKRKKKA
jgi:hypothetical protein